MTRAEKIEALARDMYGAGWFAGRWCDLGQSQQQHWIAAATLAQDRIDAASAGQEVVFEAEQFLGGRRIAPGVYRLVPMSQEVPDAGF